MYVTPTTTIEEIKDEIRRCEDQLYNVWLDPLDRQAIHTEIDYLESFLPKEDY